MQAFEFLRQPRDQKIPPVVAISGEDAYLRREALEAACRRALGGGEDDDLSVGRFAGESASLSDVLDEVRTLPFLAKTRIAVVDNADPFVSAHRKELEAFAEKPSTTGVLILMVKSWPANTRLAKLVDKVGLAIDAKSPSERELPAWLVEMARLQDKKLESDAARLLLELVGPEVGLLASEVEKLATYVGDRKTIKSEDVTKMVGAGRLETIWRVIDAATTGNGGEALEDLDRLLGAGEPPFKLLGALGSSLSRVHHAGELRLKRLEPREACREAGIKPFAVDTTLKQHTHLGPTRVRRLPEMLLRTDLDLKGFSQLPPRTVLEKLIVELARARRD
ncbi:MAG TPA: DNA polymerase III subunit delta [Isosphaeraceae bacterium]|nr:DNA polymerase III subunit delta [Isosphaeraceae bacterium]